MHDRELYQQILGLTYPWQVEDIRLDLEERQVVVVAGYVSSEAVGCPSCGRSCGRYDHRKRRWRHLDTCQLQTVIEADIPRVNCPEHG